MSENLRILELAEEAKKLRAKVAVTKKSNAFAKSSRIKGQSRKLLTVSEKRIIALEAELKAAQGAQKQSVDEAVESRKEVNKAAAQIFEPVLRVAEVEKDAKIVIEKLADMDRQITQSAETAKDAIRQVTKPMRRVELLT